MINHRELAEELLTQAADQTRLTTMAKLMKAECHIRLAELDARQAEHERAAYAQPNPLRSADGTTRPMQCHYCGTARSELIWKQVTSLPGPENYAWACKDARACDNRSGFLSRVAEYPQPEIRVTNADLGRACYRCTSSGRSLIQAGRDLWKCEDEEECEEQATERAFNDWTRRTGFEPRDPGQYALARDAFMVGRHTAPCNCSNCPWGGDHGD